MKRVFISTILIVVALSACEEVREEVKHNETIYLQSLEAKTEAQPLLAIVAYYQERILANLTNIQSPECDPRIGICDDLNLFVDGVKNELVIKWLVSHPEDRETHRSEYIIPFKKMDSVSYGDSALEPEGKAIFLYMNVDEQEFYDFGVYDTIQWK